MSFEPERPGGRVRLRGQGVGMHLRKSTSVRIDNTRGVPVGGERAERRLSVVAVLCPCQWLGQSGRRGPDAFGSEAGAWSGRRIGGQPPLPGPDGPACGRGAAKSILFMLCSRLCEPSEFGMPIYEYQCAKCEHRFEQLVKSMSGADGVACPECGSRKVTKQPSVFAARNASSAPAHAPGPACGGCGEAGACPFRG